MIRMHLLGGYERKITSGVLALWRSVVDTLGADDHRTGIPLRVVSHSCHSRESLMAITDGCLRPVLHGCISDAGYELNVTVFSDSLVISCNPCDEDYYKAEEGSE